MISTGYVPASCLSFDRKEVPEGTQHLKNHGVNKRLDFILAEE